MSFWKKLKRAQHWSLIHKIDANETCEFCGKVFNNNRQLREHIRSHDESKSCTCELCGKAFKVILKISKKLFLIIILEPLRVEKTLAVARRSDNKVRILRRKVHLRGCAGNASRSSSQQTAKIHLRVLRNAIYSSKTLEKTFE